MNILSPLLKFGLFEKHTKFEKIFLMVCTSTHGQSSIKKSMIYLVNVQNHEEHFFQILCASQKVQTLSQI